MPAVEVEGKGEKVVDDVEFDRYGFYQPPKIQRKLPIYLKGADPKHCLDIIDDLYAFYVDMEVSVCELIVMIVCDGCVFRRFLLRRTTSNVRARSRLVCVLSS
jgi:hypothetical protein